MTFKISRSQVSTQPNPTHQKFKNSDPTQANSTHGWTQPMTNSEWMLMFAPAGQHTVRHPHVYLNVRSTGVLLMQPVVLERSSIPRSSMTQPSPSTFSDNC